MPKQTRALDTLFGRMLITLLSVREQMRKDGIVQELGSNFRLIVVKEGSNLKAGGQAATRSPSRLVAIIFC